MRSRTCPVLILATVDFPDENDISIAMTFGTVGCEITGVPAGG